MNNTEGPFAGFFQAIAGSWSDWLFMFALLALGTALILGMGLKVVAVTGTLLMLFMYLSGIPIGRPGEGFTNPVVDAHWIDALAMITFALTRAGDTLGLGRIWHRVVGDSWLR